MLPISESATLPKGFRFHYQDGELPRTPEKAIDLEPRQPSPPRPRLKIKRRNAARMSAPTEQFLASVAAADLPLPSIELHEDTQMIDRATTPNPIEGYLAPQTLERGVSPPRTPLPQLNTSMQENCGKKRDWYQEASSTPDGSHSIPSSALSDPSDWSDDSYFSGRRVSLPSGDSNCTSPDDDIVDPFVQFLKGKEKETSLTRDSNVLNSQIRSKTRNNARWSKEMNDHLWQTYQVYLQDPTVTPFRIGASAVPPEGVICRVSREARRSWKGPKPRAHCQILTKHASSPIIDSSTSIKDTTRSPEIITASKSGSNTPTGKTITKTYLQWPHSSAVTRNQLRELCKRKDSSSVQRHRHLQSRSPTPFTQERQSSRYRLRTPGSAAPSSFSIKDIAFSLTTSSAESMQPDGPLAKLSRDFDPASLQSFTSGLLDEKGCLVDSAFSEVPSRRLGSPFTARTYGPSSSKNLGLFSKLTPPQSDTLSGAGRRLRSPLRFTQSRSLNGTQKRRASHALEEELSPKAAVDCPSILNEQLFCKPVENQQRRVRARGFSLGDASLGSRAPELTKPSVFGSEQTSMTESSTLESTNASKFGAHLLPSAMSIPPRLGSPFSESGMSNTFPRRLFQPIDGTSTIRKRPFATVHHSRRSIESYDFGERSSQSRLAQLDQKLAEIRRREATTPTPKQPEE